MVVVVVILFGSSKVAGVVDIDDDEVDDNAGEANTNPSESFANPTKKQTIARLVDERQ